MARGSNTAANDEMIRRLENELQEKQNFANEIVSRAQSSERDLSDDEKGLISETRGRMEVIKGQLDTIEDISRVAYETTTRARQVGQAIDTMKGRQSVGTIEYRSAGAYAMDMYKSAMGNRESADRLETYMRAAAHITTGEEAGVIPDPIVGPVVDFIDAARPLVVQLGARPMPYQTWHRPLVTQNTSVGVQGSAGAAGDEKTELVSQPLILSRVTGSAVTYGGYVNVSRQSLDFSQPQIWDVIINDLAAQYAIETEGATGAALMGVNTTPVTYPDTPTQQELSTSLWEAAGQVYLATRGQGKVVLAVSPTVLQQFAPLFAPYGVFQQWGTGFDAGNFRQGVMGTIAGIPTVMSAGLGGEQACVFSTAAIEAYEQRVGCLQVVEPSVVGVQVAYAGYFCPLIIKAAGIIPLFPATG
jgi:HK97 family phage major capsid protein